MKQLVRDLAYQLVRKRIDESSLEVCEVSCKREELSFFSLSTNSIISFEHEGDLWYFRECPCIVPAEAYWPEVIDRFFDSLDRLGISDRHFSQAIPIRIDFEREEKASFRKYIESKRSDKAFRKALQNADRISRRMAFSVWENQKYDSGFFDAFALYDLPEKCRDIAVYFLWNMRTAAANFRVRSLVRGKRYSHFAAVRATASRIVAEELNLEHLITPTKWCRLIVDDGCVLFGAVSPSAPGRRMRDVAITPQPSMQRELLCLNILDVICNQTDHGPNNYNVLVEEDGRCSICAFDNDNAKTFFPVFTIRQRLSGCTSIADRYNIIQRPHMDGKLAQQLRWLNVRRLCRRLRPYLNWLQIAAMCHRLRGINRAIAKTEKQNPDFLIDHSTWSVQTVAEEMSGKYGLTYLKRIESLGCEHPDEDEKMDQV